MTLAPTPRDAPAQSLLLQNARLIDGTGAAPRGPVSILIRDGSIREIAPNVSASSVPTLDLAGGSARSSGAFDPAR